MFRRFKSLHPPFNVCFIPTHNFENTYPSLESNPGRPVCSLVIILTKLPGLRMYEMWFILIDFQTRYPTS